MLFYETPVFDVRACKVNVSNIVRIRPCMPEERLNLVEVVRFLLESLYPSEIGFEISKIGEVVYEIV